MSMLTDAKLRIADIDRQMAELKKQRAELYQWIQDGERLLGSGSQGQSLNPSVAQVVQQTGGKRANSFKAQITRLAEIVLADGDSKTTRELVELAEGNGIEVGGKSKVLTVSAVLSRQADKFASGPDGWSLKK